MVASEPTQGVGVYLGYRDVHVRTVEVTSLPNIILASQLGGSTNACRVKCKLLLFYFFNYIRQGSRKASCLVQQEGTASYRMS